MYGWSYNKLWPKEPIVSYILASLHADHPILFLSRSTGYWNISGSVNLPLRFHMLLGATLWVVQCFSQILSSIQAYSDIPLNLQSLEGFLLIIPGNFPNGSSHILVFSVFSIYTAKTILAQRIIFQAIFKD